MKNSRPGFIWIYLTLTFIITPHLFARQITPNDAAPSREKALAFYNGYDDSTGIGNIYEETGRKYYNRSQLDSALVYYSKAQKIFESIKNIKGLGHIYFRIGDVHYINCDYEKALQYFSDALKCSEAANDSLNLGNIYYGFAYVYFDRSENKHALEMFKKSGLINEKIHDQSGQASALMGMGDVYAREGDRDNAVKVYKKALSNYQAVKDTLGQGNIYFSLGVIYYGESKLKEAEGMYLKALPFYEAFNSILSLGNIFKRLGIIYCDEGNYFKSLESFSKAEKYYKAAGSKLGSGNVLLNEGVLYYNAGNMNKAKELFLSAMELYKETDSPIGLGNSYHHMGEAYVAEDSLDLALEMFLKALPYFEKANTPLGLGNVYEGLGDVYSKKKMFDNAFVNYNKSLGFYKIKDNLFSEGNIYKEEGDIYRLKKEYQCALDNYSRAMDCFVRSNNISSHAFTILAAAGIYDETGRTDSAYTYYNKGLDLIEKIRTQADFAEIKMSITENASGYYEDAVSFMLKNNYNSEAFINMEKQKARVFLDQLAEKKSDGLEKGINPGLKEKRDSVTEYLSSLKAAVSECGEGSMLDSLKGKLKEAEISLDSIIREIRFNNPLYASVNYPDIIPVEKLQKILHTGEILLEYFLSSKGVYAFAISRNSFNTVKLPDSLKTIEKECNAFNKSLTSLYPSDESRLYRMLIQPLEGFFTGKNKLIIVPEGILSSLPFEALITGKKSDADRPEYLVERYTIKYIQSGTVLAFERKHANNKKANKSFAGFGDPVYDYENFSAGKAEKGEQVKEEFPLSLKGDNYHTYGGTLNRLEGSGEEVDEISKLFSSRKVLIRTEATEENVKKEDMKNYAYILLSCHGIMDDEFQSLVLSRIPGAKEDGYLTLDEIMGLDWNAELAVLSACKSGTGKIKRGEGVIGLTRAVMYAGAKSAVVSLWNVDEKGTKELMVKFFRNMIEKKQPEEEALRNAKLELLLSGKYAKPFYWGAFVMYGE